MCIKNGPEFQCFQGWDQIPVLIEKVLESQSFEGKAQKTNVYKNRARIKVFGRIRWELQCL